MTFHINWSGAEKKWRVVIDGDFNNPKFATYIIMLKPCRTVSEPMNFIYCEGKEQWNLTILTIT